MSTVAREKKLYKRPKHTSPYFFPAIIQVSSRKDVVGQYEKFEIDILLDKENIYDNPYDPDQVSVSSVFTSGFGKKLRVPGFFYQDFSPKKKLLKQSIKSVWKIRFAPNQKGTWSYRVEVKNRKGSAFSKTYSFRCISSSNCGFIRVNKADKHYFAFDSGRIFYAIGQNLCWVEPKDPFDFSDYLTKLNKSNQNWIRIWNWPFYIIVEWSKPRAEGLGRFSQPDSWKFDKIFEIARRKGIYIQMVINWHGMFYIGNNQGDQWHNNPYNKKLGGPCKNLQDFFSNQQAKNFFKRKLRYFIARWGYSTNILAWEFFNEVDIIKDTDNTEIANWHKEMAHYMKQNDPFSHLVTTSFLMPLSGDMVWRLKDIDFTQVHDYVNDVVTLITSLSKSRQKYRKPCLIAEIAGEITDAKTEAKDKKGIRLHNSLWASLMSPLAGTAMYWWWDEHIRQNNLYYHYKALGEFAKDVEWDKLKLIPINVEIEVRDKDRGDVVISPILNWEPSTGSKFKIASNGFIKADGILSKYFHASFHSKWRVTPTFDVDYREDNTFSIYVCQASWLGAGVKVVLDGKVAFSKKFPPASKDTTVNQEYKIKVPKGRHIIEVVNHGRDWTKVGWVKFCNKGAPRLKLVGMQNKDFAIVWCKNRQSTAENYLEKFKLNPIKGGKIRVLNLNKGNYEIEYWDTYKGKIFKRRKVRSKGSTITLDLPDFTTDIACKVRRLKS
ncbi:MAG: DUF5060 domain-containing protein [bacterium]